MYPAQQQVVVRYHITDYEILQNLFIITNDAHIHHVAGMVCCQRYILSEVQGLQEWKKLLGFWIRWLIKMEVHISKQNKLTNRVHTIKHEYINSSMNMLAVNLFCLACGSLYLTVTFRHLESFWNKISQYLKVFLPLADDLALTFRMDLYKIATPP